jgi:serine protease Do
MDRLKETLYDILGVPRNAKLTDIGRAYNRHKATMRAEHTPPDERRNALLHEAFEVLSDPQKRAAYDASLRRSRAVVLPGGRALGRGPAVALLLVIALVAFTLYQVFDTPKPQKPPRLLSEVQTAASLAVGRLQSMDISGKAATVGIAFTLEEGVMVTPCAGITPNAQLVVIIPPRSVPARVIGADAQQRFCRLEVAGAGSWPLTLNSLPPRVGEKVYAAEVGGNGEVFLREGSVKRVLEGPRGRMVETSLAVPAGSAGRPLLDAEGRVIAVAMISADGKGEHVGVPADWLAASQPRAPAPRPAEPAPEAASSTPKAAPASRSPHDVSNMPVERRERLEKAFRPPPTVPDDL